MSRFRNVLFIGQGLPEDTAALRQALELSDGDARFSAMILCPPLPRSLRAHRDRYLQFLRDELLNQIRSSTDALGDRSPESVDIQVASGRAPAVTVVRQVLDRGYDLVVKRAESTALGRGFRSLDMNLLRDCPCPLWLSRTTAEAATERGRIAVAIDPHTEADEEKDLSFQLLGLGRFLADRQHDGKLHVVGCGELAYEEYLRNNVLIRLTDEEVMGASLQIQREDRSNLENLVRASGVGGTVQIDLLRGEPDERIPEYLSANNVDVLIMGTVARTGIPGFVIGNTAENLLQKINCSLLAVKPKGFISPLSR